jgi:hypothetical protein
MTVVWAIREKTKIDGLICQAKESGSYNEETGAYRISGSYRILG